MTIAMKKIIQYVVVLMTIFYIGNYAKCTQSHNIFNSVEQNVLGEKIWVCNLDSKSDIVTVSIGFKNCGFHNDPVNKQGLLFLTLEMISSGGKGDFDEENYKKNKNSIGAKISTSIEHDYVGVTIRAPRENILEAIDLVKKQALKIKFDEDKFYKMQNQIGSMLINIANEEAFAQRSLLQSYLSNHPYSYNADGNMSGWQNITLSDIKNYKDKIFAKNNLEIVICAKEEILKDTLIKDIVKEVKQDLAEKYNAKKIEKPKVVNPEKIILMPRHGKESGFIASCMLKSRENKMLSYDHKDYHALLIINRVLGGCRLYSRIWDRIREKMGLVYTISTNISNIDFFPLIACYGRCSNDNTKEVLKLIKEEWGKIHNISENEFNDAKKGIIGSIKVSLIGSLSVANRLLHDKIRGRKINHIDEKIMSIQNITYDDAKAAARHYFDPQKLSFIVVGNAKMAN